MSDLRIDNITDRLGQHGPEFVGVSTVSSGQFVVPRGPTENRGGRGRGFFGGGYQATPAANSRRVSYIEIATTGNSVSFGDLTVGRQKPGSFASATRGIWMGGATPGSFEVIDYIITSSQGGGNDFGNLTGGNKPDNSGVNDSTRGMTAGGENPGQNNIISFITIASTGDSSDFGDMLENGGGHAGISSPTRGIWAGAFTPSQINTIEYVTTQTKGNAKDFGDLTIATKSAGGCSSTTRGLTMGGQIAPANADSNIITYITMATTGNAVDFGDLVVGCRGQFTCSSNTRGIAAGGEDGSSSPYVRNHIDYVTIASAGNATDFGDIVTSAQGWGAGCSDVNGGLG